ncbi:MAG: hypothetical protein ACKOE7_07530, partial [Actinomycetota bacterium]
MVAVDNRPTRLEPTAEHVRRNRNIATLQRTTDRSRTNGFIDTVIALQKLERANGEVVPHTLFTQHG